MSCLHTTDHQTSAATFWRLKTLSTLMGWGLGRQVSNCETSESALPAPATACQASVGCVGAMVLDADIYVG